MASFAATETSGMDFQPDTFWVIILPGDTSRLVVIQWHEPLEPPSTVFAPRRAAWRRASQVELVTLDLETQLRVQGATQNDLLHVIREFCQHGPPTTAGNRPQANGLNHQYLGDCRSNARKYQKECNGTAHVQNAIPTPKDLQAQQQTRARKFLDHVETLVFDQNYSRHLLTDTLVRSRRIPEHQDPVMQAFYSARPQYSQLRFDPIIDPSLASQQIAAPVSPTEDQGNELEDGGQVGELDLVTDL